MYFEKKDFTMNKYTYYLTTNKNNTMKEKGLRRSKVQDSTLRHSYYLLQTKTDVVATTQNILTTIFFLSLSITYKRVLV